jgi:L-fucose isomerase-like protein
MSIAIYTLTSELHDEKSVAAVTRGFLDSLDIPHVFKGNNYVDYGHHALDLIYVRTGGTEGIFRRLLPQLQKQSSRPFYLLTSGKSNSLAASLEILSYLRQHALRGEVLHGEPAFVANRIQRLAQVGDVRQQLDGQWLGIIGQPSDWLIASQADKESVSQRLGINLVDIDMEELLEAIPTTIQDATPKEGALMIYEALKSIVSRHQLQGFTLRCFDLLTAVHNTGCLALAKLNAEGIVAGCEGDVPALLSMKIGQAMTGVSGFQANPAYINSETGEMLLAHCTIPLNMVERYELDTHFESGIGIGIRGYMKPGDVTLFKVSGDLTRHFIAEGQLLRNQAEPDLCRTQQVIRLDDAAQAQYFLTNPIGNHHIVLPGHVKALLSELFVG